LNLTTLPVAISRLASLMESAMKSQSYMTRAMRARDPRFAIILGKLGYERGDVTAVQPQDNWNASAKATPMAKVDDPLPDLRKQYQEIVGKRPFHGWDADVLKDKIAEAKAAE
jgi:hypothetical protein